MSTTKITVSVKDVQSTPDGRFVLVGTPTKANPKGNYVVNAAQVARLAQRTTGTQSPLALAMAIRSANGAATLTFEQEECKAGQPWKNEKTGEAGVYEKDWTKTSNFELNLGVAVNMKMFELAFTNAMQNTVAAPVTSAPVAVAQPALGITNEAAAPVAAADEAPAV